MICSNCGATLSEDSVFCNQCGTKVVQKPSFCEKCGNQLNINDRFCGKCGNPVDGDTLVIVGADSTTSENTRQDELPDEELDLAQIQSEAEQGNAIAQKRLGTLYYYGLIVSQDYSLAFD